MSDYVIRPEEENSYTLTPLPGVDQTLLTDIGETIYVPLATNNTYGVVKPGDSLSVTNGVLNVDKATSNSFGSIKPGNSLSIEDGVLNVDRATESAFGSVKPGVGLSVTDGVLNVEKSEIDLGNVSDAALVQLQANIDAIKNNTTPIKASNGSVQLGFKTVEPAADSLQFRNYNFLNADGELYTFTGSEMTKVADVDWTGNQIVENVTDNLTTTDPTKALSAKQGKLLKDLVDGKQQTETYSNISAMVSALNSASNTQFKQGYNFYIIDIEVPDFWVTEVKSTSSTYTYTTDAALVNAVKQAPVQIGYYEISLLETAKVETKDAVDYSTINRNLSDELQAIGVIDQQSGNANKVWTGTLAQYNAIVTKDDDTIYIITDDANSVSAIPETTSDLINDSGFIDNTVNNLTNYTKTSDLGDMAFKDTVDYSTDVINKPTINNGTLTIQKNGNTIATFTANSSSNVTANIEADAQVQADWNQNSSSAPDYIKNKPSIPAKVSDLTNDSGFITNTVNNLANYYLKTETYTQSEVNVLVGAIKTIKAEIVAELPTASADTHFNESKTIYLVSNSGSGNDYYDEFITVRSGVEGSYTYAWEKIGNTQIDLSGYVQKTTTIAGVDLQDNITKSELNTALDTVTLSDAQTVTGKKTFSGDIAVNSQIDMGTGAIKYSYNNVNFNLNGNDVYLFASASFQPNGSTNNNKVDLGGTNRYWKDLYLAGNLTDGTNSISVANIENKNDYTKLTALSGSAAPTTATVANFVGQIYIDTTNDKIYECTAITEDTSTTPSTFTYTWELMLKSSSLIIQGSAQPTNSTPADFVGQLYKFTNAYSGEEWWQCTKITEADNTKTYTWAQYINGRNTGNSYNGQIYLAKVNSQQWMLHYPVAQNPGIAERLSQGRQYSGVIDCTNINQAVKAALTDTYHLTMTSAEQTVAKSVLGINDVNLHFEVVVSLDTASSTTWFDNSKTIYLVPNSSQAAQNVYDEYITMRSGTEGSYTYSWEQIGSTAIDLSNYVPTSRTIAGVDLVDDITKSELQTAIDFDTKLDKVTSVDDTGYNRVYVAKRDGTQTVFKLDYANTADTSKIPVRGQNGSIYIKDESIADPGAVPAGKQAVNKDYVDNKVAAKSGSTAPTSATVADFVGQIYLDTTANATYECTAITSDGGNPATYTYAWVKLLSDSDIVFGFARLDE